MPELTTIHLGLLALMLVVGVVLGWVFHSDRSARDKIAITASWQEQIESQYSEQNRLAEQNKSLMEQVNQFYATSKESAERSDELTNSLREACELRDGLQQQLKENDDILQVTTVQRDRLRDAIENRESQVKHANSQIKQKDDRILRLGRDLDAWHSRLPPLLENFKTRNQEALKLASELELARGEIRRLEEMSESIQTSIDPLDSKVRSDGLIASNEPHDDTLPPFSTEPQDQGAGDAPAADADNGENDPNHVEREVRDNPSGLSEYNDDLKKIKGIGPAIEKKLNDLGVYRFNQIAEMSEYDIDRVAQQLKGFRSRIYREDWLGQARDLQYQKDNNLS